VQWAWLVQLCNVGVDVKRFFLILILSLSCSGCTAQLNALDDNTNFFPGYLGGVGSFLSKNCYTLEWAETREDGQLYTCQQNKQCEVSCHD